MQRAASSTASRSGGEELERLSQFACDLGPSRLDQAGRVDAVLGRVQVARVGRDEALRVTALVHRPTSIGLVGRKNDPSKAGAPRSRAAAAPPESSGTGLRERPFEPKVGIEPAVGGGDKPKKRDDGKDGRGTLAAMRRARSLARARAEACWQEAQDAPGAVDRGRWQARRPELPVAVPPDHDIRRDGISHAPAFRVECEQENLLALIPVTCSASDQEGEPCVGSDRRESCDFEHKYSAILDGHSRPSAEAAEAPRFPLRLTQKA